MGTTIEITPAAGTWVVRAGGAVLGESRAALSLREGGRAPVIYFPRADIAMEFLDLSETRTRCPHKGEAAHFHIMAKSGPIHDAAWSYEAPKDEVREIAGYLAFYPGKVEVEEV